VAQDFEGLISAGAGAELQPATTRALKEEAMKDPILSLDLRTAETIGRCHSRWLEPETEEFQGRNPFDAPLPDEDE